MSAHVKLTAAVTSRAPVRASVAGGVASSINDPSPSSPPPLWPQHRTPPAVVTTQVCALPAESDVASPTTSFTGGVARSVVVPSPSWPKVLAPQQRTPPAAVSAHV